MPYRIAIVDDHAMLREALGLMLERLGCHVVGTAENYDDGAELIERVRLDVAVVDVVLGGRSGIDLARRLLADDPALGIVLYTGSSDAGLLLDGLHSGARGYALKEGGTTELMEAIATVARGGTYVDPRLRPPDAVARDAGRHPALSPREREIVALLADGLTNEEVARCLVLSAETVKTHVRNAMGKLEAKNRVHAIAIALRSGHIPIRDAA